MIEAYSDDEVVKILLAEVRALRLAGHDLAYALKYGGTKARAIALAAWEQTRRGVSK